MTKEKISTEVGAQSEGTLRLLGVLIDIVNAAQSERMHRKMHVLESGDYEQYLEAFYYIKSMKSAAEDFLSKAKEKGYTISMFFSDRIGVVNEIISLSIEPEEKRIVFDMMLGESPIPSAADALACRTMLKAYRDFSEKIREEVKRIKEEGNK